LKILNYQAKRIITAQSESFKILEHNTAKNLDVLEGIPTFAKIFVPSLNRVDPTLILPAYFTVINMGEISDIQIFLSMDNKEPNSKFCEKQVHKKLFDPGSEIKFNFKKLEPENPAIYIQF